MHSFHSLQGLQLILQLHGCLHLSVYFLEEGETNFIIEVDEREYVGMMGVVL